MTLKFEHNVKIRADLRKIRAKFEQNSSKKEAVLTEDRAYSPIPHVCEPFLPIPILSWVGTLFGLYTVLGPVLTRNRSYPYLPPDVRQEGGSRVKTPQDNCYPCNRSNTSCRYILMLFRCAQVS